jgi:membrane protease YdiL (CAAX protease family)
MTLNGNNQTEIGPGDDDLMPAAAAADQQPEFENSGQQAGRRSPDHSYPGIGQAIKLLLMLFLLQVLLSIPIAGLPASLLPAATAIASLSAFAVIIIWGVKRTGSPFREVLPLSSVPLSVFAAMLVTVVGLSVILSELGNMLQSVFPPPAWFAAMMDDLIGGKKSLWGSILLASIVAPVTEEPMFRGLILRGFLARYSVGKAIVVSALLFALFHLNPWQFAAGAATGLLFAWCFAKTRSLVPCLFGHAVNNSLGWIFMALQLEVPGYTGEWTEGINHQPLWFDALGLFLAAAGIMWLAKSFRRSEESSCRIPPY